MTFRTTIAALALAAGVLPGTTAIVSAQSAPAAGPAAAPQIPADPWPRVVDLTNARRCSSTSRRSTSGTTTGSTSACALAIKTDGAKDETFGVIFATARTQVDKVARTVVFENLKITKTDFPTLPDHGASYTAELQNEFATSVRTIALDRLRGVARARRHQAADGRGAEQSAAGDRQLLAGDSRADRRRAGDEAGARSLAVRSA